MKIVKIIYYIFLALIISVAIFLIGSVLPITGNYKIMVVKSGSMEPAIATGSVLVVKPASQYQIGDIITFGESSKIKTPTTHRIVEIKVANGQTVYITKGDANNAADQKEVSQKEVLGKTLFHVPYVGYLVAAARTKLGFALIIIIPALAIITEEIWKIKNEVSKNKNNKKSGAATEKSAPGPEGQKNI